MRDYSDLFFALCIALFGILTFYPGSMTGDSIDQWRQVLEPETIGNWFPPVMVYLWIALNKVSFGPQGMLILHFFVFAFAIFFFGRVFFSDLKSRILFLFIGIYPATFLIVGIIWKDVSMMVSIAMAIALLFVYERNKNVLLIVASLVFFVYGVSVRHNAIVCAIPFFLYLFLTTIDTGKWSRISLSIIFTLLLTVILHSFNGFISTYKIHPMYRAHNIENSIFIWDFWGMSVRLNENIIPKYVFQDGHQELSVDFLKEHYRPYSNTVIWLHEYLNKDWRNDKFPDQQFKKDFIDAIESYPYIYLKTRYDIMPYMLGIKKTFLYTPFLFHIQKIDQSSYLYKYYNQLSPHESSLKRQVHNMALYLYRYTAIFDVWIYLLLLAGQLAYFLFDNRYRHSKKALMILCVGGVYWLPYFFVTTSAEFRYSSLTVFCSVVTVPLLITAVLEKYSKAPIPQKTEENGS